MIWLQQIADIEVERREIRRKGGKPYVLMAPNGVGVMHTTEGYGIEGAWTTLNMHHSAPHFIVGDNRIIQCRPLGVQAAALLDTPLHPNKDAYIQVEMLAFTGGSKDYPKHAMDSWMPVDTTLNPLSKLLAFCAQKGYVPLKRAYDWPDDCKDIKGIWATAKNSRRTAGIYGRPQFKGWFSHLEVPGNNHYDVGAMRWAEVFSRAGFEQKASAPEANVNLLPILKLTEPMAQSGNVLTAQMRLKHHGAVLLPDRYFGRNTQSAVKAFQSLKKLAVTGEVDAATWTELLKD